MDETRKGVDVMTKMTEYDRLDQIVKKELKEDIIADIKNYLIFNESDLQSCVYHHMRNHLHRLNRPEWCVFNKPYLKRRAIFPDIVLFQDIYPRIAIELKWWNGNWNEITAMKDRDKLKLIRLKYPTVTKGFFCYVYDMPVESHEREFYSGQDWEKRYYFDVPINIRKHMRKDIYREWKKEWQRYRYRYEEKLSTK